MKLIIDGFLSIEVTQQCNLNCEHCMKGKSRNNKITKEVVEKIFEDIIYVNTLVFTGGEISLAYDEIKMIIDIIKSKKIVVEKYQIVLNGTIYNKKMIDLLNENFKCGEIYISTDYFHDKSILEKYKDSVDKILFNFIKIMKEPNFEGLKYLPRKLYDCGNATGLDNIIKVKTPSIGFISRCFNYKGMDFIKIGPQTCFDVFGNLTNGNNTYEINNDNYFGNIFEESLVDLIKKNTLKFCEDDEDYKETFIGRLNDFYGGKGISYVIKDRKLVQEDITITNNKCDDEIYDNSKRLIFQILEKR